MFHGCKAICIVTSSLQLPQRLRCLSSLTKVEVKKKRNELFNAEKRKQRTSIGRIEKIEVRYSGSSDEVTLMMNKHISTPYDCANHISEGVRNISAVAEVNGAPWDMHRPIATECSLRFYTMSTPEKHDVNKAFWRTCSLMLGAVAETAFKDNITIHLHSFPSPNIRSGSFSHDICMGLDNWMPTTAELQSLSALFINLAQTNTPIERLEVREDLALEMFQDNPYKSAQIPNIAKHNNSSIVLYRLGEHIDISKGPMIANTQLIGRCTVASIHKLNTDDVGTLYRFQGIALPTGVLLNHFAYGILEDRARKLNKAVWVPNKMDNEPDENISAAAAVN